ncbi:GDSL-type esterase/lipase family protein [Bacteroidales bacterium OttesenSCG-928-M06]|nr:GDSL-type esterase/lipase family protein [Bacteroidales bacterium OttesenSCG-928-M06]
MKAYKTLIFIVGVLVVLGIISAVFPKEGIYIGDKHLFFPTIEDMAYKESGHSTTASLRVKEMEESLRIQNHQDSIAQAYADSLSFYLDFFKNHPSRISLPGDDPEYLTELFEAFDNCKEQEVIHILHYGDSQIEGDRITASIRQKLQERFGGSGPGVLPAIQPIPTSAVGQIVSGNIERYTIAGSHQNKMSHRRYGALGQVGIMSGETSISISSRNWKETYEKVKVFDYIRLFVGQASPNFGTSLTVDGQSIVGQKEKINSLLDVYTWELAQPTKRFNVKMQGTGEVYGVAVDSSKGIAMSNIPFRGSSGTFYTAIDSMLLSSMFKELNTKLILLEFGGNTVPYSKSEKSINTYKNTMGKQIAYLRRICPDAKIIMIGPADMSTKIQGKLQSYPHLENFIQGLKEAALENGAAFWNMYEVMGGKDSMIDWVKNSPSLAAPDHIHFNKRGAERIGDLFYESLMIYYDYYTFNKGHKNK